MPELPEVETVRRTLEPLLTGRTIVNAVVGDYRRTVERPDPESFVQRLSGRRITALGRRGKFLLVRLDSGDTATVHLRMTGELLLQDADADLGPHLHLWLELDNGKALRYYDIRKFGRWCLLSPDEFSEFDASLGPEPLESALNVEAFTDLLRSRRRIIKPLLLDQTFIAGIGNIYADEALFRSGIHPQRRSDMLYPAEVERLLEEIRNVLLEALEHRGTTLRNYRDGSGEPGNNLQALRIYSRADGDPCPRCGNPVQRLVIGQRGTRLCPACQPFALPR